MKGNPRWGSYLFRLLWLVGLWVFAHITFQVLTPHPSANVNYKTIHTVLMLSAINYFLFGMYLAVLFIQNWRPRFNPPLLIFIFMPCVSLPILESILGVVSPVWLIKANTMSFSSVAAGASLMLGLFGSTKMKTFQATSA